MNKYLTQKGILLTNMPTKRCLTSYVTRELQIKMTVRYNGILVRVTKTQNTDITICKDVKQQELISHLIRLQTHTTSLEYSLTVLQIK